MIKVMHIITDLSPGGAEIMLYRLAQSMDRTRFESQVVSLMDLGDLTPKIQALGVRVRALGMKRSVPNPLLVICLAKWIREYKPHVIQTWMYHSNLVGGLAALLAGGVPVVWGIHYSALDPSIDKRRTMLVDRACAFLSRRLPARIVCCSEASQRVHQRLGYVADKLEVINNGFDLQQCKPDSGARASVREELGIPPDAVLIGIAAHFRPQKDHLNFSRAAARLHAHFPKVHFLLCGLDITWRNSQLVDWIDAAGIRDVCHLLGPRHDMPRLFAAMDIAGTSSAGGEAFPLVVGEAMACGTPCVVTDVGDSARIVGDTGKVVAPRNPDALAQAWHGLIEAGSKVRSRLGMLARGRVQQHFALPAVVDRYQSLYMQLAGETPQYVGTAGLAQA